MDGKEPATKADLVELGEKLETRAATLDQKLEDRTAALDQKLDMLRSESSHQCNDLVERMAEVETRMLSAIYDLAKSGNQRMTHIESDNAALNKRLGIVEDRLLEVEKRLNLPPAA